METRELRKKGWKLFHNTRNIIFIIVVVVYNDQNLHAFYISNKKPLFQLLQGEATFSSPAVRVNSNFSPKKRTQSLVL